MNNTHFLARVGMLIGLILVIAACAQASPPQTSSIPTVNTSRTTATPTEVSWQTLQQRPLHLPTLEPRTPCPTTHGQEIHPLYGIGLGDGPVYPVFFGGPQSDNVHGVVVYGDAQTFAGGTSDWGGVKVLWVIKPPYRGPVLIRGGRLDGSSPMRFNGGLDQQGPYDFSDQALLTELRLPAELGGAPWPNEGTYTRLQAPGCYAYQVDGLGFSYVIIFKAIPVHLTSQKP